MVPLSILPASLEILGGLAYFHLNASTWATFIFAKCKSLCRFFFLLARELSPSLVFLESEQKVVISIEMKIENRN